MINNGAHFYKADLHIHSYGDGGSYDVADVQMNPHNIVDTAIAKGLSIISITDHNECINSISAVDYAKEKDILVIPGIEISTIQGHLLVYFPNGHSLRNFYGKLTISGDRKTCQNGIVDCLAKAKLHGGIGVLAHIELAAGFETSIGHFNQQMEEIFKHECLLGLEISSKACRDWYTDSDETEKKADRMRMMAIRNKAINNEDSSFLPKLMSSDAHKIDNLGRNIDNEEKLTRIKADSLTFDAFRIALLSGSSRVRIETELPEIVPSFQTLTIEGGLLDKQEVSFSNNLTCIIGGRGTGKSTMLECIKSASGNPSLDASVVDSDVWPNSITLTFKDEEGTLHTFRRDKNAQTFNLSNPDGIDVFPIECYGQGETAKRIEKSGEDSRFMISFLDYFLDLKSLNQQDDDLKDALRQNQSDMTPLRLDIKQKNDIKKYKELNDRKLQQLKQDKAQELVAYHISLAKERDIRKHVIEELNLLVKKYKEVLSDNSFFVNFSALDTSEIKLGVDYIQKVKEIVDSFAQIVSSKHIELQTALRAKVSDLKNQIDEWKRIDAETQSKIDEKKRELESRGIPFDLGKLNKIINDSLLYEKRLKEIEQKEKLLKEKVSERRELIRQRLDVLNKKYLLHQAFASKTTDNLKNIVDDFFVSLKYLHGRYSPTYKEVISRVTGWRSANKIGAIVENKTPIELADAIHRKDLSFMDSIQIDGVNIFDKEDKDLLLLKFSEGYLYEDLESEAYEDLPQIIVTKKVKDAAGNDKFIKKSLYQLSMGQQQSILLAILLQSDSKRPLLIDQPEDNLDSEFIYKSIVKNLRRIKETRQVIIVTHNANIAVLGDAELIIPLKSTSTASMVMERGSIDNPKTKELCCEILEGGKRAFKKRQEIYNI